MSNSTINDEVIEKIKDTLKAHKKFIKFCENESSKYKDKTKTNNKYEASYHEHYKGMKSAMQIAINELEEVLLVAEQDIQENKKRAYCE